MESDDESDDDSEYDSEASEDESEESDDGEKNIFLYLILMKGILKTEFSHFHF